MKDEIDEKQKILEQAAQAIEAMEENQTEMKTKFDEKVQELQNKISDLEVNKIISFNTYKIKFLFIIVFSYNFRMAKDLVVIVTVVTVIVKKLRIIFLVL